MTSDIDINIVKEYWDKRPCNIRHSSKSIGTKEYFEEVSKKKFRVEPHILSFTEFNRWKNKNVLEIGCGIGTVAIEFAKHGAIYTGCELSKESLELTRKRFEVYELSGDFYEGNAEELTGFLPQKKYDLIYSFGVIHHSPKPKKIFNNLKNYLKADGELKVMLYAKNSWKNFMIENGLDQPEAQYGCPIANVYTEQEVKDLMEGYEISKISQDHIFPYQIEPYKNGEYIKQPWFSSMPDNVFKTLEKSLGWHMLIDAKLC